MMDFEICVWFVKKKGDCEDLLTNVFLVCEKEKRKDFCKM